MDFLNTMYNMCKVIEFAKTINMPQNAVDSISKLSEEALCSFTQKYSQQLINPTNAASAYEEMKKELAEKHSSFFELAIYLQTALLSKAEIYDKKDIENTVFLDTMKIFTRFAYEHYESFGSYGFDRGFWTWRQTAGLIFRLGTLEFEIYKISKDFADNLNNKQVAENDYYLSVHIPSDAKLSREELDNSYNSAKLFFAKHFPEYKFKGFICSSWMLAPKLKNFLGEHSGIIRFLSDYNIIAAEEKSSDANIWIFKTSSNNYSGLPENTSLQKNVKKLLLDGGQLGTATGIIII